MAICDSCKRLAATSKRSAVPAHLSRIESGSAAEPNRPHYRCLTCQSQWRWVAPATWVLILPPISAKAAPGDTKPGWWMALGQLFGGSRAGRRSAIELRAPRLSPRKTPSTYPVAPTPRLATPPAHEDPG